MTWATPISDLRTLLSDGAQDKLSYRKRCVNKIDGVNTVFKTFEMRRVSSFVGSTAPIGVYVSGTQVSVASDDLPSGEFVLTLAPANGSVVEATYYLQWFLDAELDGFLKSASQWLGMGPVYANLDPGLQPAALNYSASESYLKMSLRWANMMSDTFKMEDAPNDNRTPLNPYRQLSLDYRKIANTERDDFYKRQGQALAPRFQTISGSVRDVPPNS